MPDVVRRSWKAARHLLERKQRLARKEGKKAGQESKAKLDL